MILKFHGQVKHQKFIPDSPYSFQNAFNQHEGKRVTVTVGLERKPRSIPQNKLLHKAFSLLADAYGCDPAEMKGIVKWQLKIKKTSDLSTIQAKELFEWIQRWAITPIEQGGSGLNCYIPDPDEADFDTSNLDL